MPSPSRFDERSRAGVYGQFRTCQLVEATKKEQTSEVSSMSYVLCEAL